MYPGRQHTPQPPLSCICLLASFPWFPSFGLAQGKDKKLLCPTFHLQHVRRDSFEGSNDMRKPSISFLVCFFARSWHFDFGTRECRRWSVCGIRAMEEGDCVVCQLGWP
ncbi:uncharacterized protein IWZ02DRAFT_157480 [Phyllosticta citriasiana]|uniref:uncharacterized protein n=1 Tax=Phyllosticta citriasiana TaxID=595635 RepID=UPI0030FDEDB6